MAVPKVIILMADDGHEPTETSVPYTDFKKAGFEIHFATELGKTPQCDQKLLKGITQKLIGASGAVVSLYDQMASSPEFQSPKSWSSPDFSLESYNLVFLPGGHEKAVRQLYDSPIIAAELGAYYPLTRKPSNKTVAAVCHGVLSLVQAKILQGEQKGKSVLYDSVTTTLPARFEQTAYWGTRLFLGDYYKTYGRGSNDVEADVRKVLENEKAQFKGSLSLAPFVVQDEKYNYISARFPGDMELMGKKIVDLVKENI